MSLYEQWLKAAYTEDRREINVKVWDDYVPKEQKIYEYILANKVEMLKGTPQEMAMQFGMSINYITGFIDGINDTIVTPVDMETLREDGIVELRMDYTKLYRKMVEYKADHLQQLPQWDNIFTAEQRKNLYKEQKISTTFVRGAEKVGRNDPCPCGSGKKYKKCCQNKEEA